MHPTRIAIVEDNRQYRETLTQLVEFADGYELAGAWSSAADAVEAARSSLEKGVRPWDIGIMDVNLPGMDGIEGTRQLKALDGAFLILILTVYEDPATVLRAVCAGADGYLLKNASHTDILEHLEMVRDGGAPLTPGVAATLLGLVRDRIPAPAPESTLELSDRERDVLQGLVDGLAYKQVADELGISIHTVRTYIRRLYKKLQVHSVAEAVSRAIREGLVS